jgi:hypothetical protein
MTVKCPEFPSNRRVDKTRRSLQVCRIPVGESPLMSPIRLNGGEASCGWSNTAAQFIGRVDKLEEAFLGIALVPMAFKLSERKEGSKSQSWACARDPALLFSCSPLSFASSSRETHTNKLDVAGTDRRFRLIHSQEVQSNSDQAELGEHPQRAKQRQPDLLICINTFVASGNMTAPTDVLAGGLNCQHAQ